MPPHLKLPRRLLVVAAGFAVVALLGAGAALGTHSTATKSTELHVALPSGGVDHLDPALWYFATTWKLSLATCTPLLTFPDKAGAAGKVVVAGIARMPRISGGGRVYTFTIKPGLKFPNGQPIDATVEKKTLERLFAKKLASPAAGFFNVIQGSDAYAAGKATAVSGIKAAGHKLTIKLTAPVGSFLKRMTVPWTCPVPLGTSAAPNEKGGLLLDGPYVVASYSPNRKLVLQRNPAYNAAQLGQRGHFDKITVDLGADASQAELSIKAGQLDTFLDRLPAAAANVDLRDASLKGRVFVNPTPSVTYLWLNSDVPPLNNPKVRQAINYAIDRNQILRVWGGPSQGRITDQILPPTMGGYREATIYPAAGNVAKAKALLAAAHVKLPLHVTLRTRSDAPGFAEVAQAVQAQLRSVGIDATVRTAPDSVNGGVIGTRANKIPMGINNWTQDYPDGDDFFGPLLDGRRITPTNNNNYAAFNNAFVNRQIDRINPMVGSSRDAAWERLDITAMRKYAPWAPLFNPAWVDLLSTHVTGYVYTPVYGLDLTTLRPK